MKVTVRTRHHELASALRHRLYTAFARVSPWVRALDLEITAGDRAGAHGRLQVRGRGVATIVVEQHGADPTAIVTALAERAEHAVRRKLARRRALVPVLAL